MDFDATQVIGERPTTNSIDEDGKTRIGILRIDNAEYEIVGGFNRIGRSPLCKVVLNDPTVSKVHAEIQAGLEATFICDLKSANGTTFKGLPLKPFFFYPINDGDSVYLGRVKAVYEIAKSAKQQIDITPKKSAETRTCDGARQSTSSSVEDDRLFEDADESMVPGTARKDKKRLFRLPEIPVDHQKNKLKLTSSIVIGESEQVKESNENHAKTDSTNIHEMETQNILDPPSVHEAEAPKRRHLENSGPMLDESIEKSIYDAETQVSIATNDQIVKPTNGIIEEEDLNTIEKNVVEENLRSSGFHVIAETDDESETDDEVANVTRSGITNDMSDNSITDDENEFASVATSIAQKKKQRATSSKIEKEQRNSLEVANETDMELLPTQILDVATSTPMSRLPKDQINDSHEEKLDEDDDDDLFGAPTQVLFEVPIDMADSSSKILNVDHSDERKLDTDDEHLLNVPTNIFDIPASRVDSSAIILRLDDSDRRTLESSNQDVHDAPTQAFDIPIGRAESSAKVSRIGDSGKRKLDTSNQDIHDKPTQAFDIPVGKADSSANVLLLGDSDKGKLESSNQDVHDAQTQPFDIPVGQTDLRAKILRRNYSLKPELGTNDQNLHDAETQILEFPVDKANSRTKMLRLNRFGKRKLETNNQDLHDAPTQIVDIPVANADSSSKLPRLKDSGERKLETNYQNLHDAPTQVFDIPANKVDLRSKILRRNDSRKPESKTGVQDLDNSPTQLFDVSVGKADSSSIIEDTPKIEEKENNNRKVNLDDTITRNLGNIFGDEATNEDDLMDEPTQLMTQNLVDILRPTQAVGCSPTRESTKTPRLGIDEVLRNETIDILQESPSTRKRKTNSAGTLGFLDGQAVRSRDEFSSSLTKKHGTSDEVEDTPVSEIEASASGHQPITGYNEEDDILFGLPEVTLYGTLSNPGSPALSSTSSHNDLVLPKKKIIENETEKNISARIVKGTQRRGAKSRSSIDDKVEKFESNESESPIQTIKLLRGRKKNRRPIIDDDDDDEDNDSDVPFDYNDLKTIADKLLASDVTTDTRVKSHNENFGNRSCRVKKNVETKKATVKTQRTRKLSKKSLSLIVTDANSELSDDDDGENTKSRSTRLRKISNLTRRKNISKDVERESSSAEVKTEIFMPVETKTYATVKLTRLNENDVPKATRLRRLTSTPKETTMSPITPARSRGRRTMGDAVESRGTLVDEQYKILFTGVKDEDYEKIVTKLGGWVVSDPSKASVLISDKIRRTFKFLCSMARGIKVVSIAWLTESNKAGRFLDCDRFILEDPVTEAKFHFNLAKSLEIAQGKRLLDGYTIFVTPKVNQPEIHELKGMIEACGGRVLVRPARSWDSKMVIISREDDFAAAKGIISKAPKSIKITVQSTEFILTGILRQEINLLEHKLM